MGDCALNTLLSEVLCVKCMGARCDIPQFYTYVSHSYGVRCLTLSPVHPRFCLELSLE